MSLINIEKTKEELVKDIKLNIIANNKNALQKLKFTVQHNFNQVWDNNAGLTPQEVLDCFGSEVLSLFQISKKTEDYIKSLDETWDYLVVPYEITINQDGTVTVGDKIE